MLKAACAISSSVRSLQRRKLDKTSDYRELQPRFWLVSKTMEVSRSRAQRLKLSHVFVSFIGMRNLTGSPIFLDI